MNIFPIVVVLVLFLFVIGMGLFLIMVFSRIINKRMDQIVADQFSVMRRRNNIHKRILSNYTRR